MDFVRIEEVGEDLGRDGKFVRNLLNPMADSNFFLPYRGSHVLMYLSYCGMVFPDIF